MPEPRSRGGGTRAPSPLVLGDVDEGNAAPPSGGGRVLVASRVQSTHGDRLQSTHGDRLFQVSQLLGILLLIAMMLVVSRSTSL